MTNCLSQSKQYSLLVEVRLENGQEGVSQSVNSNLLFKKKICSKNTSGDATKAWVLTLASFLPVKFLLYDVTMVFFSFFGTSCLQG